MNISANILSQVVRCDSCTMNIQKFEIHTLHTHTQVAVITDFPLSALIHMHEAMAMCETAHCQPGLNGQGHKERESYI